jgi:hypothetical protein
MTNIVKIGSGESFDPDVLQLEMIGDLKRCIRDIESGRIVSIAMAAYLADGTSATLFRVHSHNSLALLGAVTVLKTRMAGQ